MAWEEQLLVGRSRGGGAGVSSKESLMDVGLQIVTATALVACKRANTSLGGGIPGGTSCTELQEGRSVAVGWDCWLGGLLLGSGGQHQRGQGCCAGELWG